MNICSTYHFPPSLFHNSMLLSIRGIKLVYVPYTGGYSQFSSMSPCFSFVEGFSCVLYSYLREHILTCIVRRYTLIGDGETHPPNFSSSAAATARHKWSLPGVATTCSPMGKPSLVSPRGTAVDGISMALKIIR